MLTILQGGKQLGLGFEFLRTMRSMLISSLELINYPEFCEEVLNEAMQQAGYSVAKDGDTYILRKDGRIVKDQSEATQAMIRVSMAAGEIYARKMGVERTIRQDDRQQRLWEVN